MHHEPGTQAQDVSAADLERARRDALCPSERADAISYDWARVGFGIVMAGGAYPLVLAAIFLPVGSAAIAWGTLTGSPYGPGLAETITLPFSLGLLALFAGMVAILWSGFVTVLTLPVVYLFVWSLELRDSIVRIGAFAGGLIGFIAVLPFFLAGPWSDISRRPLDVIIPVLLGPIMTTVLGQLGGAWGGSKSRELGPVLDWQKYLMGSALWKAPTSDATDSNEAARPHLQFGIRHLLWIAVWLSLLLTLIRLSRIPYELMLPLLLAWLLFQGATLWIGGRLALRFGPWWARRRQARST